MKIMLENQCDYYKSCEKIAYNEQGFVAGVALEFLSARNRCLAFDKVK